MNISKRGQLKTGTKVVILDRGPNFGKTAFIDRPVINSKCGAYLVRIDGQDDVRTAVALEPTL